MEAKDIKRLPDRKKNVSIEMKEVVRDVGGKPHVFVRVKLSGFYFPAGALEPFILIGDAVSRFATNGDGGLTVTGYFDRPIPPARVVTLGYGDVAVEDFELAVDPRRIPRLDRAQLPREIIDPFR